MVEGGCGWGTAHLGGGRDPPLICPTDVVIRYIGYGGQWDPTGAPWAPLGPPWAPLGPLGPLALLIGWRRCLRRFFGVKKSDFQISRSKISKKSNFGESFEMAWKPSEELGGPKWPQGVPRGPKGAQPPRLPPLLSPISP